MIVRAAMLRADVLQMGSWLRRTIIGTTMPPVPSTRFQAPGNLADRMASLEDSRLKLARAEVHLHALQSEAEAFLESDPAATRAVPEGDNGKHLVLAKMIKSAPREWSNFIGDFAHNCRSALDTAVYSLSDQPSSSNQFPICSTAGAYSDEISRDRLGGVSHSHQTVIDCHQPYHLDEEARHLHPLSILRTVSNIDKHRTIVPALTSGRISDIRVYAIVDGQPVACRVEQIGLGFLKKAESPIARVSAPVCDGFESEIAVNIFASFGKGVPKNLWGEPVIGCFLKILEELTTVIDELEKA